jgi:DNA-damage-inducible protein J
MAANALIQSSVDEAVRERASAVLEKQGLTIADAMRILVTRIADEGALPPSQKPYEPAIYKGDGSDYDEWFRAKVQEGLDDPRPSISHEEFETKWQERRAKLLARATG